MRRLRQAMYHKMLPTCQPLNITARAICRYASCAHPACAAHIGLVQVFKRKHRSIGVDEGVCVWVGPDIPDNAHCAPLTVSYRVCLTTRVPYASSLLRWRRHPPVTLVLTEVPKNTYLIRCASCCGKWVLSSQKCSDHAAPPTGTAWHLGRPAVGGRHAQALGLAAWV
jgi:hypothetical protein